MNKLTTMKAFVTVVERGSFSAAAEELNLSKAMVSKHVRNLENLLEAQLLHRNTRALSLTEAGAVYRERCKQILWDIEDTERLITELNARPIGTLKVTAPTSFGTFHLVPAITDYKAAYPDVSVQMRLNDQLVDLVEDGYDVAVRVGRLSESSLIARKLADARLVVCGAPTYFERCGVPQVPDDLAHHNCLRYTQAQAKDEWLFKGPDGEFLLRVSGNFEANAGDAVRMAAIDGCGLAQLPTYAVGQDIKAGQLQTALNDYEPDGIPIHAVYSHRRHLSATVRTFVEFLYTRFQTRPY